jgi:hypothetical protein
MLTRVTASARHLLTDAGQPGKRKLGAAGPWYWQISSSRPAAPASLRADMMRDWELSSWVISGTDSFAMQEPSTLSRCRAKNRT